ncbi:hypothetical protein AALO_G00300900, partial [Alosa alosa]
KGPLCLLLVLLTWVSEPAGAAALDTNIPSDAGVWTEHGNEIQNYSAQTVPLVCQLSTCEFLLSELGALQEKMEAMEAMLQAHKTEIEELTEGHRVQGLEIQALRHRSNFTEAELREHSRLLEELSRAKPKVAFAAALGDRGNVGPASNEHTIPFKKILTNVGSAYNPSTGVFIVPVRGVYYLSFSSYRPGSTGRRACVSLFRNDQRLLTACDRDSKDSTDSAGNGATLLLEKGDHVYITLHSGAVVYDDYHNRSCFRGFLLFQM